MLDPGLTTCSKQAMFLNLIYKSLKADIMLRRVKAFVKRLLQVTCTQMPPFICGALYLVSEILKAKPDLRSQLDDHPVCSLLLLDPSGCWGVRRVLLWVWFSLLHWRWRGFSGALQCKFRGSASLPGGRLNPWAGCLTPPSIPWETALQ